MSTRVQVLLDELDREAFRRRAEAEGLSLSAWLRQAGRDRLAARPQPKLATRKDLRAFFAACDAREKGREPEWREHLGVIERSKRSGGSST
jgi:hypothetical protein